MRLGRCLVVSALTATWALEAEATYSIVAVDTRDGTVGGAVASCVPVATLETVYGAAVGKGALMTQSYLKVGANADGLALFEAGSSASEVIAALTAPAYDVGFQLRQYAAVDTAGGVVTFTGTDANQHASGVSFSDAGFAVAIQGNYLTGPEVIEQARAAFTAGGCDLAARLHAALAAAGSNGAGDRRCTPDGVPAQSAVLEVDPPGMTSGSLLRLAYEAPGDPPSEDPVAQLGVDLDAWRASHPCPVEEGGGGAAPGHEPESDPEPDPSKPADEADGCTAAPRGSADGSGWSALVLASIVVALIVGRRRRT
ncbi:MAG: DUF1028 domain-containing protein [Myxococcales bacterium]|nr:DUF1028 domain-containing protein [Myxococcales bacterium]